MLSNQTLKRKSPRGEKMRGLVLIFVAYTMLLSGCALTLKSSLTDIGKASRVSGKRVLAVAQPSICNDYPVEFSHGTDSSATAQYYLDLWFLAAKPSRCEVVSDESDDKKKKSLWSFGK